MGGTPSATTRSPLTLGTAGHIDHGKTTLISVLTGTNTDRLPEERSRGISIELGYAVLALPSGRRLSVVDVPGHERFVRTMVAGATGIDLFLMVVAADDGVMPQTREHAAVLEALGVGHGVVAITKADVADPRCARRQAAELLPGVDAVAVSARTGEGVDDLRAALDELAGALPGRADSGASGARLHVDRSFTVTGAGTVVTGTLWSGEVSRGDEIVLLPAGRRARVRAVEVHDEALDSARAGQRVALNLVGVRRDEVSRGDVVAGGPQRPAPTFRIDAALAFAAGARPGHGDRVQVHHGTREAPARLAELGGRFWQLRLEQPLVPAAGDRVVLRSIAPPDTLGGGVVLDPAPRRHGPSRDVLARLTRLERGEREEGTRVSGEGAEAEGEAATAGAAAGGTAAGGVGAERAATTGAAAGRDRAEGAAPQQEAAGPAPLSPAALALERRLREAGAEPPIEAELGDAARELPALLAAGRAVRVGRALYYHPDALAAVHARVVALCERDGEASIATLRDDLRTSRKFAQALLEHFDGERVTRRVGDAHVLRVRRSKG